MKIKISKSQWEMIGEKAGWKKEEVRSGYCMACNKTFPLNQGKGSGMFCSNCQKGFKKAEVDQLMPTDGVQKDPCSKPKFVKKEETQKVDAESKEEMLKTYLEFKNNGRANEKGITEKDVDPKELAMGIEVEYEHSTNRETAKRIALDHLAETNNIKSKYYTYLKEMEKKIESEDKTANSKTQIKTAEINVEELSREQLMDRLNTIASAIITYRKSPEEFFRQAAIWGWDKTL